MVSTVHFRLLVLATLAACVGCGGGGTSGTFSIVGKWKLVKIADLGGEVNCPGALASGFACGEDTGYVFLADGTLQNYVGNTIGTWFYSGNGLWVGDRGTTYEGSGDHLKLGWSGPYWKYLERQ